jgi:myo-inositol-1(or 4)-monophosphatase
VLAQAGDDVGEVRAKSTSRDLVTEWDRRAEEAILEVLREAARAGRIPDVPVLAEETGARGDVATGRRWLVDPLDGTVNFTHGLPLYAVSIALEDAGRPVVGVVSAPALGWEFFARRGGGAFMNGWPMQVSGTRALDRAMLVTGFPYDRAQTRHNFAEWEHFQVTAGACRRLGAAALDLSMVARGWLDGYWESRLSPWDLAAGALLVEEAGGIVTDTRGGPFSSGKGEAVAGNPHIHAAIVRELAPLLG